MPSPSLRLIAATLLAACAGAAHAEIPQIMVVTSDPQYPWTEVTDQGGPTDNVRAEALVREQYESIVALRRAHPGQRIPVIINGDLTSHGQFFEHQKINELFAILGDNFYYGLGNHDYENNLRNNHACAFAYCATDSLDNLARHVTGLGDRVHAFDLRTRAEPGGLAGRLVKEGSWSYAFKADGWPDTLQLQLNNSPDYAADLSTFSGFLHPVRYNVTASADWLVAQSRNALQRGEARFTLAHVHKPEGWRGPWSQPEASLAAKAAAAGVKAIFSGHYHMDMGVKYVPISPGDTLPLFNSGSASQRTYLVVEHWPEARRVKVYGVRNNDPSQKELLAAFDV
jgi:predicted phosphodiesterase